MQTIQNSRAHNLLQLNLFTRWTYFVKFYSNMELIFKAKEREMLMKDKEGQK
jgi:hypothetical protein